MDPCNINIIRQITCYDLSAIFEVDLNGHKYALKVFHDNGDSGYTEKGRDLNRFRRDLDAYKKLLTSGVCARGFPRPRAILLEYFPYAESLNCVDYSDAHLPQAIEGMHEIHRAGVHHQDIYPKNLLLVRGNPGRLVWIDFDVATTFTDFGPKQLARCDYEIALVKGLAEGMRDDQAEGLPPNTKFC
ncbi:serine/threonine protein kinase [Aspergillus japonicus CBS 114.51]|uniref:Serine/threonine protein kinase n=1 Tax=Aspergillus japonicus CBS 114.51 TaxID=1448312 RepID=A0A8T8WW79_ASPJA|nr:serine/threonine protein kinase [Aspergillus japonicus CBS 114.51]RAH80108.1 serine/threonine protein kinase [Aspergillus japonicus CBS 114.51]